jgi:hypothetical protein
LFSLDLWLRKMFDVTDIAFFLTDVSFNAFFRIFA